MGLAWVLNFDAELELARQSSYSPSRSILERSRRTLVQARQSGLVQPNDRVLWPLAEEAESIVSSTPQANPGWARAWSPTPRARSLAEAAGYRLPPAPERAVVRLVNHRRFAQGLHLGLDARWVSSFDELQQLVASSPGPWMVKRALSFSGFGCRQLRVPNPSDRRVLADDDCLWLAGAFKATDAALRGVLLEPAVNIEREFSVHGWLSAERELSLGRVCVQRVDAQRAFVAARLALPEELHKPERAALFRAAESVAEALSAAGYYGPFGIDAYRHRDPANASLRFNPLSELNARFTMSWRLGMGRAALDLSITESDSS